MTGDELSSVGRVLEAARGDLSKRQAARRAGISEGRWRQIVTGRQRAGGVDIPVNPKRGTLIAMAKAVGADVNETLHAAGFEGDEAQPAPINIGALRRDPHIELTDQQQSEVEAALIASIQRLSAVQKRALLVIVSPMAAAAAFGVDVAEGEIPLDLAWAADHQAELSEGERRARDLDAAGEEPQVEP